MSLLFRTALALAVVTASAAFAQDHSGHDHAGHDHGPATQAASQPATTATSQPVSPSMTAPAGSPEATGPVTNAMCPIMDQPINEQFSVVYEGKTVYFCCAACPAVFNSNPERYVSQLPQFSETTN